RTNSSQAARVSMAAGSWSGAPTMLTRPETVKHCKRQENDHPQPSAAHNGGLGFHAAEDRVPLGDTVTRQVTGSDRRRRGTAIAREAKRPIGIPINLVGMTVHVVAQVRLFC